MLYIQASFVKLSQRVSQLQTGTVWSMLGWLQFTKGHKFIKLVDGVMVLNLCTLFGWLYWLYCCFTSTVNI